MEQKTFVLAFSLATQPIYFLILAAKCRQCNATAWLSWPLFCNAARIMEKLEEEGFGREAGEQPPKIWSGFEKQPRFYLSSRVWGCYTWTTKVY